MLETYREVIYEHVSCRDGANEIILATDFVVQGYLGSRSVNGRTSNIALAICLLLIPCCIFSCGIRQSIFMPHERKTGGISNRRTSVINLRLQDSLASTVMETASLGRCDFYGVA